MKIKLKTPQEIREMERAGLIECQHASDDGEFTRYLFGEGKNRCWGIWTRNLGEEYLVVDHPNPISKDEYEFLKVFFHSPNEK